MRGSALLMLGLLVVQAPLTLAGSGCPDASAVSGYLDDFAALRVSHGFGKDISHADAACACAKLTAALPAVLVPAAFGALPRYEADFLIVVKDAGLAEATTPLAALAHIKAVVPFIELPDIMIAAPTGAGLVATNAAFRGGVKGTPIPVEADAKFVDMLADMVVVIREDLTGQEIGRAKGDVLMGNLLNAAIWLAKALRDAGMELKPGDLLSLGGFKGAAPTRAGTRITLRYLGLPGDPAVSVQFY
jgi:2-keto-4-pentenoate hydratase